MAASALVDSIANGTYPLLVAPAYALPALWEAIEGFSNSDHLRWEIVKSFSPHLNMDDLGDALAMGAEGLALQLLRIYR